MKLKNIFFSQKIEKKNLKFYRLKETFSIVSCSNGLLYNDFVCRLPTRKWWSLVQWGLPMDWWSVHRKKWRREKLIWGNWLWCLTQRKWQNGEATVETNFKFMDRMCFGISFGLDFGFDPLWLLKLGTNWKGKMIFKRLFTSWFCKEYKDSMNKSTLLCSLFSLLY